MNKTIKICLALAACISIVSCKSREEKALALIDKEMFASLYDYESYQPVETKIDSAFNVAEYNTVIVAMGILESENIDKLNLEIEEMKSAQKSMRIWSDSYSSYGRSEYYDARDEVKEHLENAQSYGNQAIEYMRTIREKAAELDGSFCGWKVTHKFRCKTKGGSSTLGEYIYIIDKDMKEILYEENTEDESVITAKKYIREAIEMTENEINELASSYEIKK